jgi:hypothetical protein
MIIRPLPGILGIPGKHKVISGQGNGPLVSSIAPATGSIKGGTSVTITGQNFAADGFGNVGVTFGGKSATSIVLVNSTTITCVTPSQVSTGIVDVVVSCGTQTATLFGGFSYYTITILSVVPSFGPFAGGTNVMINGIGFSLGCTVSFDGIPATNVIFIDSSHMRATTPSHSAGFSDVTVTEA